jgi:hypothetical protein
VEVVADREGPVTIAWPNAATLPKRLRLKLTDLDTGGVRNMRAASSLTVNVAKDKPHRFRITAETALSRPLDIVNLRTVPTRGGGYTIAFNLTGDAAVTGRVLTLGGKVAASLGTSRAASTGENKLHWDGRAQDGANLPAGPYVVEITARSDDGQVIPRKMPMVLIR